MLKSGDRGLSHLSTVFFPVGGISLNSVHHDYYVGTKHRSLCIQLSEDTHRHPEDIWALVQAVQIVHGIRRSCDIFPLSPGEGDPLQPSSELMACMTATLNGWTVIPKTRFHLDIAGIGRLLCEKYREEYQLSKTTICLTLTDTKPTWMQRIEFQMRQMEPPYQQLWDSYMLEQEHHSQVEQRLHISQSTLYRYAADIYSQIGQMAVQTWGWNSVLRVLGSSPTPDLLQDA